MNKMDKDQDKKMIKKAFKQHDLQGHKADKPTKLELKHGGSAKVKKMQMGGETAMMPTKMPPRPMMPVKKRPMAPRPMMSAGPAPTVPMKKGGMTKMASGGMPMKDGKPAFLNDGKGMKKGGMAMKKMMSGGMAKGGGVETKGKTKGKMVTMKKGGKAC